MFERGTGAHTTGYVLEAAMAAQDVAPGLADQHAVHGQHVQPHLQQDILQPTHVNGEPNSEQNRHYL